MWQLSGFCYRHSKDFKKSLLLSGREEKIIGFYLNRGDKKMKFVIAIVVLLGISFFGLHRSRTRD